ncbi:MAG: MBL fold metallo-hydrolase [Planctomycetota bacterium]
MPRLTVMGSADAFCSAGRGNSCYWVDDSHGAWMLDFGPTALMQIRRFGRDPDELDAIFITHLHGDHIGGFGVLLIDLQYRARRTRPLIVAGPPGTARAVSEVFATAYASTHYKGLSFPIIHATWSVPGRVEVAGRTVEAVAARHDPAASPTSLRVEVDDCVLAFSGDTGWHPPLARVADGADLFLCECSAVEAGFDGHMSLEELRAHREALAPKRLLVTHMGARVRARPEAIRALDAEPVDDGMYFDVG